MTSYFDNYDNLFKTILSSGISTGRDSSHPVADGNSLLGGLKTVKTKIDRNMIYRTLRKEGMLVYVKEDGEYYTLKPDGVIKGPTTIVQFLSGQTDDVDSNWDLLQRTGLDGQDGADGLDGADGAEGPQGPQGPPGQDGPEGPAGKDYDEFVVITKDYFIYETDDRLANVINDPSIVKRTMTADTFIKNYVFTPNTKPIITLCLPCIWSSGRHITSYTMPTAPSIPIDVDVLKINNEWYFCYTIIESIINNNFYITNLTFNDYSNRNGEYYIKPMQVIDANKRYGLYLTQGKWLYAEIQ